MSDFFMFNETIGKRDEERDELEGYEVRAPDGKVGTVMDVCDRPGESFIVVDTGRWLLSKKVVLPAGVVERVDHTPTGSTSTARATRSRELRPSTRASTASRSTTRTSSATTPRPDPDAVVRSQAGRRAARS